ncbi:hypothetical protein CL6EHI_154740 [Entamoeba histolytica]|uniref:Uncharacterized protein n=2 Tax=Entamoeba histolytica TaxID=5759 RepID=C4MAG7_ENTH1|nr:hypothetical protein EHI_154740 [Entamoeba histolytica HM-1:IMSS]EAL43226.2 hypothetical protein EHI_154740 [Entamoeba histolytica HM-1:IMSS]GAT98796.1 hypothetical protein CL6EHI_154740 [Entamoeba histolytica]|eukprot:XP_648608.2 hypothetical protein EHI_154740 [Entamoeba histolytica HM-1:IMSS]
MIRSRNNCPNNTHEVEFVFNTPIEIILNKGMGVYTTSLFDLLFNNTNYKSFCNCFKRVKIFKALISLSIGEINVEEIGLNFPIVSTTWFPTYIRSNIDQDTADDKDINKVINMINSSTHLQQQVYYPGGAFQINSIIKAMTLQEQNYYGPTRVEGYWKYDSPELQPFTNENVSIPFYPWYFIGIETPNNNDNKSIKFNCQWYITVHFDRYIITPTELKENEGEPPLDLLDLNVNLTNEEIKQRETLTYQAENNSAYEKVTIAFPEKEESTFILIIKDKQLY